MNYQSKVSRSTLIRKTYAEHSTLTPALQAIKDRLIALSLQPKTTAPEVK